jgi:8-oxo-dGTP pyrophosphatase MutT (NUDIX family)
LQGGWETDETVEEAACREALEEAGVRGLLQVLVCMVSTSILVQGLHELTMLLKNSPSAMCRGS